MGISIGLKTSIGTSLACSEWSTSFQCTLYDLEKPTIFLTKIRKVHKLCLIALVTWPRAMLCLMCECFTLLLQTHRIVFIRIDITLILYHRTHKHWVSDRLTSQDWVSDRLTPQDWVSDRLTPQDWVSDHFTHQDLTMTRRPQMWREAVLSRWAVCSCMCNMHALLPNGKFYARYH